MSSETEKMDLRSRLKSLDRKRSNLACKMATQVGIEGFFFIDQLPLDDPRISEDDKESLREIQSQIYDLTWKLDELENDAARHQARRDCFDFINLLSLDEAVEFLRKAECLNTSELIEKLIHNPNLIEEVVLNE